MKSNKNKKQNKAVQAWNEKDPHINSDIMGSYTGMPSDKKQNKEAPTQDADDL